MRVLLVDDNIDALEVMQVLLELEGHTVRTASNGQDAISTAANLLPDVAIIDIGMPDMDGCELAHVLRSHPEFKDMVLIALTGYSGDADKSRALSAGFDHHFVKPLSLDKLRAVLAHCGGRESTPV
jgi:CheY-like chemotaxis protein